MLQTLLLFSLGPIPPLPARRDVRPAQIVPKHEARSIVAVRPATVMKAV